MDFEAQQCVNCSLFLHLEYNLHALGGNFKPIALEQVYILPTTT
jgi:hypothetical protein